MATKKKENDESNDNEIAQADVPKNGVVDLSKRVKVKVTGSPYHADGEEIECSPVVASKMVNNGWGTLVAVALFMLCSIGAVAQNTMFQALTVPVTGAKIFSDTVTNTNTNYLTSYAQTRTQVNTTAFVVVVTKISGTVAGTITLQGSLDGTNFKAIPTVDTQTSVTTVTAADASAVYTWRINGSPYTYYRVSWTGAGTMAASFTARLIGK